MRVTSGPLRVLLATLSGFLFTMFVICLAYTWREAGAQRWSALGYDWLRWDLWSRAWEIKEALAGAALTLALALLAEATANRQSPLWRLLRWGERTAAHPIVVAVLALAVFVAPPALAGATRPKPAEGAPNLVYVMVDTWRADHVGWLGYERPVTPGLDELVRSGVVFERAVSAAGWTKPSVATQLTGLLPSLHGAVSQPVVETAARGTLLPPMVTTWVEVLRAHGWETAMYSNNPNILPSQGFDQGAAHFVDYIHHPDRRGSLEDPDSHDPGRSEYMLPEARAWIDAQAEQGKPFAAYVHIMDPHYPYVAPAPFKGRFDKTGSDWQLNGEICGQWRKGELRPEDIGPVELERINAIYDEEIAYVDHYLTPFLEGIRRDFPNTVIVLISDHGEEFLEHGQLGHGHSVYSELVNVPLVIWAPGLDPARVPWQVRSYDVFPTILELCGLQRPEGDLLPIQGLSLLQRQPQHRLALMENGGDERPPWHWRGVSDGEWKLVERLDNREDQTTVVIEPLDPAREGPDGVGYRMLYAIGEDPTEQVDHSGTDPERIGTLRERAQAVFRTESGPGLNWFGTDHIFLLGAAGGLSADPKILKELGYLDE